MTSGSRVHLIRRLTTKVRMGEVRVVLFDIKGDHLPNGGDRVERI